jgi:hypothetical protein
MRKSTIFISAVLTTFTLVMLYGVVYAYQNMSGVQAAALPATDAPTSTPEPIIEPSITPGIITPTQAAQLAAQVVGNTNLLSAESSTFNGASAYLITFTNQDLVYVGLDGQVLGVQIAQVIMNVSAPVQVRQRNLDNSNSSSESHDEHEDHEEQEEHDD